MKSGAYLDSCENAFKIYTFKPEGWSLSEINFIKRLSTSGFIKAEFWAKVFITSESSE